MTATVPPPESDSAEGSSRSARTRSPSRSASTAHAATPFPVVANDDEAGPLGLGAIASSTALTTLIATISASTARPARAARLRGSGSRFTACPPR